MRFAASPPPHKPCTPCLLSLSLSIYLCLSLYKLISNRKMLSFNINALSFHFFISLSLFAKYTQIVLSVCVCVFVVIVIVVAIYNLNAALDLLQMTLLSYIKLNVVVFYTEKIVHTHID